MKKNNLLFWAAWVLLAFMAVCTRFHHLGLRAMSHDESLHAFYSWQYAENGEYLHDPMMHGPLLFHLNAFVYNLFGSSDTTSRLAPALAGTAALLLVGLFRRFIGTRTAWLCALLMTVAPDIYFYSRYIRNEAFIILLLLAWLYGVFRYLEKPNVRWLMLIASSMSLSFACKEVTFIHAAIIGSFLLALAIHSAFHRRREPLFAALDLCVLTAALPLPFATPLLHSLLGLDPLACITPSDVQLTFMLALSVFTLAVILIAVWLIIRRRVIAVQNPGPSAFWLCLILFWFIALSLFTSLFNNPLRGFCSGISGSLGYWLAQHGVQRGSQPLYYYVMLLFLYNPLLPVCAIPYAIFLCRRLWKPSISTDKYPLFAAFSLWWSIGSFLLYSMAGERMPWLLVYISLPLSFMAALALNHWMNRVRTACGPLSGTAISVTITPLLLHYIIQHWPELPLFAGRTLPAVTNSMNAVRCAAAAVLLLGIVVITQRRKQTALWRWYFPTGLLILLFGFGVRGALRHNNATYDLPTEPLVFAHGTDQIKPLCELVASIQARQYNPRATVVAYDQESAWPLTWYFRETPHTFFLRPDTNLLSCPVILCGAENRAAVNNMTAGTYREFVIPVIWWPLQGYMHQTPQSIWRLVQSPDHLRLVWAVIDRRDYGESLSAWPLRHDLFVFLRNDVAAPQWTRSIQRTEPESTPPENLYGPFHQRTPEVILQGPYGGLPLSEPRAALFLRNGGFAIADTGNNRIVLLNSDASLRSILAPQPSLNAPWGLAEDDAGRLFVSDTWNGQIRVFSSHGVEQKRWGAFASCPAIGTHPESLYGPRGLAWSAAKKQLAIADTGNKRILIYNQADQFLCAYGPFNEPVNSAYSTDGRLLALADVWNRRIVLINTQTTGSRSIPALFWNYRTTPHKPYVAIDPQGNIYATIPDRCCVIKLDPQGNPLEHFGRPGSEPHHLQEPTGIFIDASTHRLLVCDSGNNRVLVYAISDY